MVEEVALMATYVPGKSLAPLPAASYERMLAAGMPSGGIDVFSRTLAEQTALWKAQKSRGIVAAYPSRNAPHVAGRAFDTQTTRNGGYVPSGAHLWLCEGGRGDKRVNGEKIRANQYGWTRTVPGERWHFAYDIDLDRVLWKLVQTRLGGLVVDGIPGPKTKAALKSWQKAHGLTADGIPGPKTLAGLEATKPPAPKPKPEPPAPTATTLSVLIANLHDPRFAGPKDSTEQGRFIAGLAPDLVMVCESREIDRNDIVAAMKARGREFKVYPSAAGTVGLLWDAAVFAHGPRLVKDFGDRYHGAVGSDLTVRKAARSGRVISTHTRPKAVTNDAGKKRDIQLAASLRSGLTLLGGDLAKNKPGSWLTGWHHLGSTGPDGLWRHGSGITVKRVRVIDPGPRSDHDWLLIEVEVAALNTT